MCFHQKHPSAGLPLVSVHETQMTTHTNRLNKLLFERIMWRKKAERIRPGEHLSGLLWTHWCSFQIQILNFWPNVLHLDGCDTTVPLTFPKNANDNYNNSKTHAYIHSDFPNQLYHFNVCDSWCFRVNSRRRAAHGGETRGNKIKKDWSNLVTGQRRDADVMAWR